MTYLNLDQRILNTIPYHEPLSSLAISKRLGICQRTIGHHIRKLRNDGSLTKVFRDGLPVYAKPSAVNGQRREASVEYAGYMTIGRGYANWF